MDQIIYASDGFTNHQNRRCYYFKDYAGNLAIRFNGINITPDRSGFVYQKVFVEDANIWYGYETSVVIPILKFKTEVTDEEITSYLSGTFRASNTTLVYLDEGSQVILGEDHSLAKAAMTFSWTSYLGSAGARRIICLVVRDGIVRVACFTPYGVALDSLSMVDADDYLGCCPIMTDNPAVGGDNPHLYGFSLFNYTAELVDQLTNTTIPKLNNSIDELNEATKLLNESLASDRAQFISR